MSAITAIPHVAHGAVLAAAGDGFSVTDFGTVFANIGPTVAGFILAGAGVGAIVLASRWGLSVALGAMKKSGK